jgi:hypothetical protein
MPGPTLNAHSAPEKSFRGSEACPGGSPWPGTALEVGKVFLASPNLQDENFYFPPTAGWTCYSAIYRLFEE